MSRHTPMEHLFGDLAHHSGLRVPHASRERLEQHLRTRMPALDLQRPEDFLRYLRPGAAGRDREQQLLAAVLTTGETSFMRDAGQIALLRETLLPALLERRARQRRLRLWSAACATGEEAYSLAIVVKELLAGREDWQRDLYGSDVNHDALRRAAAGEYRHWALRGCDEAFRQRYFAPCGDAWVLQTPTMRGSWLPQSPGASTAVPIPNAPALDLATALRNLALTESVPGFGPPRADGSYDPDVDHDYVEGQASNHPRYRVGDRVRTVGRDFQSRDQGGPGARRSGSGRHLFPALGRGPGAADGGAQSHQPTRLAGTGTPVAARGGEHPPWGRDRPGECLQPPGQGSRPPWTRPSRPIT